MPNQEDQMTRTPQGAASITGTGSRAATSTQDPAVISALADVASAFLITSANTAQFSDDLVRVDLWPACPDDFEEARVSAPAPSTPKALGAVIGAAREAILPLVPGASQVTAVFAYAQEGADGPVCVRVIARRHAHLD